MAMRSHWQLWLKIVIIEWTCQDKTYKKWHGWQTCMSWMWLLYDGSHNYWLHLRWGAPCSPCVYSPWGMCGTWSMRIYSIDQYQWLECGCKSALVEQQCEWKELELTTTTTNTWITWHCSHFALNHVIDNTDPETWAKMAWFKMFFQKGLSQNSLNQNGSSTRGLKK